MLKNETRTAKIETMAGMAEINGREHGVKRALRASYIQIVKQKSGVMRWRKVPKSENIEIEGSFPR
jgi:hypothetical protein